MESLNDLQTNEIVFPHLNIDIIIDKTAFTIFGINIQWYGIIIAIGLLLAIVFGLSQMKKYGLNSDRVIDCVIGGIIGGIIGARIYYVAFAWDEYKDNLSSIFNIREGGLAIYGGFIGSLVVGLIIAKMRSVKVLPLLDIVGMSFLIGQGIGRWGNFTNQEAFGTNTNLPWGMSGGTIQSRIITMVENGNTSITSKELVHPCFLYESLWCLLGFIVIYLYSKHRKYDGQLFLIYVGWYGLGRSVIEGLRTDSLMLGNLRISQILAIILTISSVILLIVFNSKIKRMGSDYTFYKDTPHSKQLLNELDSLNKKNSSKDIIETIETSVIEEMISDRDGYTSILSDENESDISSED